MLSRYKYSVEDYISLSTFILLKRRRFGLWHERRGIVEHLETIRLPKLHCFSSNLLWIHLGFSKRHSADNPMSNQNNKTSTYSIRSMTGLVVWKGTFASWITVFQMNRSHWSSFLLCVIFITWHSIDNNFACYVTCVCLCVFFFSVKRHEPAIRCYISSIYSSLIRIRIRRIIRVIRII